jgi:hypothetical protein
MQDQKNIPSNSALNFRRSSRISTIATTFLKNISAVATMAEIRKEKVVAMAEFG